jgi:hypothetical protein
VIAGDEEKKAEGRAQQRKGAADEEAAQEGGMLGDVRDTLTGR